MALVPIVQPPVIRALTTKHERMIRMPYHQHTVSKRTKILFPIIITAVCGIVSPRSVALVGFLMFGNLIRVCGVLDSLSETAQKTLSNLITLFLGLTIAVRMQAAYFLTKQTLPHHGAGPCGVYVRHSGRRAGCEADQSVPAEGQKAQSHDRRLRHLGVPDVGARGL